MRTLFASAMVILFLSGLLGPIAQAKAPLLLQHQGRLLDSSDQPVTGTVNLRFSIYDTQTGGSSLWTELHVGVQVTDGLFSVVLGSLTPMSEDMLTSTSVFPEPQVERYLEIQVNADAPISPRLRLVAAPYAVVSSRVSGDLHTSPGAIAIADVNLDGKIDMVASPDSTKAEWVQDDTPDGEHYFKLKVLDLSSQINLNSGNGSSSITCTQDSVVEHHKVGISGFNKAELVDAIASDGIRSRMAVDADDDGNPEALSSTFIVEEIEFVVEKVERASRIDANDDGIPESAIEETCRSSGTTMKAIQTKGTGAIAMVRMDAADSAGVTAISDIDGDGHAEATIHIQAQDQFGNMSLVTDTDDDGVVDNSLVSTCDASGAKIVLDRDSGRSKASMEMEETRATLRTHFESADMLVQSNVVVEADSGGANLSLSRSSDGGNHSDGWNVLTVQGMNQLTADIDEDGDGHTEVEFKTDVILGDIGFVDTHMSVDSNDDGVADVSADMEVSADSANFRLNGLPPGSPGTETISMTASPSSVHMAVGAATCDGTNWVNASDKNSKENFEKVDGEDILEKISGLEITKWNYKGDEDAQHIGPTAQDFKKTFGVGADDKSISTIDPSGIALAAIKELYKQFSEEMKQKDAQIDQLQKEMKKLRQELQQKKN